MSTTDYTQGAQFDSRLWDIHRMLRAGDVERARVESALLASEAELAGHDWVTEQLHDLWITTQDVRRTA